MIISTRFKNPNRKNSKIIATFQCVCGNIVVDKVLTAYQRHSNKYYCTQRCAVIDKNKNQPTNLGCKNLSKYITLKCGLNSCQTVKEYKKSSIKNVKYGPFCSKQCYYEWRSKNPEIYAENTAAMHTDESHVKIKEKAIERCTAPGYVSPMKGVEFPEHAKRILSEKALFRSSQPDYRNGMQDKNHTEASKEKMSKTTVDRIMTGEIVINHSYHEHGRIFSQRMNKEMLYRSSWEKAVLEFLETNLNVEKFDYECFRIPYQYHENKRWYLPDFYVKFKNGNEEIWEIKPKEFLQYEKVILKMAVAHEFCKANGMTYHVMTKDDLKRLHIL